MRIVKRTLALFLSLVLTIALWPSQRVEAAKQPGHFSYRVDVLDYRKGSSLAIDVMCDHDGGVYVLLKNAGAAKPTKQQMKNSGKYTMVTAKYETTAYSYTGVDTKKKYDIYIMFEDTWGRMYGPYKQANWTPRYFPKGSGTVSNPYQIWTQRHLLNVPFKNKQGVEYKLMQDLDLDSGCYQGILWGYAFSFAASLNGDKHTIRGLRGTLTSNIASTGLIHDLYIFGAQSQAEGLFCCGINNGTIKSCAVVNSRIDYPGTAEAGAIASQNRGTIKRCEVKGTTVSGNEAGGLVGVVSGGSVESCYVEAAVTANGCCGGVAGYIIGGRIDACLSNPLKLSQGKGNYTGGIVGNIKGSCMVTANASTFKPYDAEENIDSKGSICGHCGENGGGDYKFCAVGNFGAFNKLPMPPTDTESEDFDEKMQKYTEMMELWPSRNGELGSLGPGVKPLDDFLVCFTANLVSGLGLSYAYVRTYPNETKLYCKTYPMKQITFSVTTSTRPGKVKLTKAVRSGNKISIKWDAVKNAEGYQILLCEGKNGNFESYTSVKKCSYETYALSKNIVYGVRVRAYRTVNGKKVYGTPSLLKYVRIP